MLFVATTAKEALATGMLDSTDVPLKERAAVSIVMPQDENVRPYPGTSLNLVAGQSSGGFGSSVIRGRQKQWQISEFWALTAGFVSVVCLAVALLVLQCSRKALFHRLFGSFGGRSLSNSELEEHWVEICIDEEGGESEEEEEEEEEEESDEEEARDAGARQEGYLGREAGETNALQALEGLRCMLALSMQAFPYISFGKKTTLIVLLVTICTQEVALLGICSTPKVELERQKTMDFILQKGEQAFVQLAVEGRKSNALRRAKKTLRLMEQFRTTPLESNPEELAAKASISGYGILQCSEALKQMQPWVESSTPIPEDVIERALKVLSYTRATGKKRIRVDDAASSWMAEVQARVGFFGIIGKANVKGYPLHRVPLKIEIQKLKPRYEQLARSLVRSIQSALSDQPLEQKLRVQERRLQRKQQQQQVLQPVNQQQQVLQPVNQQQHRSTYQRSENTAILSSAFQSVEQLAVLRTGVGMLPSHPSWPFIIPSQRAVPTPTHHLPIFPGLHSAQPPSEDSRQHMPTTPLAPRHQLPPHSAPSWQKRQQETRGQQQPSLDSTTSKPVHGADVIVFTPREPPYEFAQRYGSFSSNVQRVWWSVPPPLGFPSRWPSADPLSPVQSRFALLRPSPVPTQFQNEYFKVVIPGSTPAPDGLMADHQHPRLPQPMPGPSTPAPDGLMADHQHPRLPQPMPGPSFTGPLPTQPTNAPSLRFPRPASQRPTSETPSRMVTPSVQFPGGWRPSHASRFVAPAAFWPPPKGAAQGGIDLPPGVQIGDLDPVGRLIAEAFPESETHSPEHAAQRRQGDGVWPQGPTLPPSPPSGSSSAAISAVEGKTSMPAGNEGASSSFELTLRTQGGAAWSLWGDRGTGSAH
ncbi:Actin associated protein Wsp1, related [Eimeria praecox]|uniref:Actin associated protein Wsp1, related n=1 Tax=Eimeria praecox TaxID=51316 RepID=U6H8K1_9EIME|nr:Actin associated protein Wsp1, related [Eimeria praecox]